MSKALSHVKADGSLTMVDVGAKPTTERAARAVALVRMNDDAARALRDATLAKGDAFAAAQIAGILAAKRTDELIPLAHPLAIAAVAIALGRFLRPPAAQRPVATGVGTLGAVAHTGGHGLVDAVRKLI